MENLQSTVSIDNEHTQTQDFLMEMFEQQGSMNEYAYYKASHVFAEKQIERLSGQILLYTLRDALGHSIAEKGSVLTRELIELIKTKGKLIELINQVCYNGQDMNRQKRSK